MPKTQRFDIRETRSQYLIGKFPVVETYPHIDKEMLYLGDKDPFHVTLPIAEIGRTSQNGLEYDSYLVSTIAEQMQAGTTGIRGHVPEGEEGSTYPLDAVLWVGHLMDGDALWAKGYVPPGANRDEIRRRMAIGGKITTSIFGDAIRETTNVSGKMTYRAKDFQLDTIDLAPNKRAALANMHGFQITREMTETEEMPTKPEEMTIADVPQPIREQIVRESVDAQKLTRVSEIETELEQARTKIAEMATYKEIITELRSTLGADVDVLATVNQMYTAATKIAEMIGVPFSAIDIRIHEMHEQLTTLEAQAFETAVVAVVAEMTPWEPKSDAGKQNVDNFRSSMKRALVREMGTDHTKEKIKETAGKLWTDEYQSLAAPLVASLTGPGAVVPPKPNDIHQANGDRPTDEQLKTFADRYSAYKN